MTPPHPDYPTLMALVYSRWLAERGATDGPDERAQFSASIQRLIAAGLVTPPPLKPSSKR